MEGSQKREVNRLPEGVGRDGDTGPGASQGRYGGRSLPARRWELTERRALGHKGDLISATVITAQVITVPPKSPDRNRLRVDLFQVRGHELESCGFTVGEFPVSFAR